SSVYGRNPVLPKTEDLLCRPTSPYAVTKLAAEAYAAAYQASFGVPVLPFRFFNIFGPLQAPGHAYAAVIPAFIHAALRGDPLVVHGNGQQSRDFTYVDSVVDVLTRAVAGRVTSETPVNLAFGSRTSLNELVDVLSETLGRPLPVRYAEPRIGDVPHSQAGPGLLRSLFPDVEPVPLHVGLRRTLSWMESEAEALGITQEASA
ncbi:MAG TPA: NAD-dependent epimerase/dehydratase family protein, partial [Actinomycetota bacterium]|nr:NAD-dependent epimerase/dehydratase family protein [Actinomycetota bacterium]